MKRIFTALFIVLFGASFLGAAEVLKFSKSFIKNFKDCDFYTETTTSTSEEGIEFTTTRKIMGWSNSTCHYQTIIESKDSAYRLNCSFTNMQLDELYDAMKDRSQNVERYDLDIFSDETDPKTGEKKYVVVDTTVIKGNKAYVTWAKYENNPYFCVPSKVK